MSEPVHHNLTIFNKADSTPTVEWLTTRLSEDPDCWDFGVGQSITDKRILNFHFTTPWEPKLALILVASREFLETHFQLDFTGSAGTVIEDPVEFVIKDGAILTFTCFPYVAFDGFPCGDKSPEKMFFDVLEYCGKYAGGSSPFVQQVAASLLARGMRVENANGREVTSDTLALENLAPRPQWAGVTPDAFAKTVMTYRLPHHNFLNVATGLVDE